MVYPDLVGVYCYIHINSMVGKMKLQQIAQEAMDYLDSVGVAADWDIVRTKVPFASYVDILYVYTDDKRFSHVSGHLNVILNMIISDYPTSKERQRQEIQKTA